MRSILLALGLLTFVPACSSSPSLGLGDVTNIPDGTGTGDAASGAYDVTVTVESCSGSCSVTSGSVTVSLCTPNSTSSASIVVVQDAGHLTANTVTGTLAVNAYAGGINADGSFDIGGATTTNGVVVTSRAEGSISGSVITGSVDTQASGTYNGTAVNCTQTATVTGKK